MLFVKFSRTGGLCDVDPELRRKLTTIDKECSTMIKTIKLNLLDFFSPEQKFDLEEIVFDSTPCNNFQSG